MAAGGGRANFLQGGDHALVNGLIPIHIRATLRNIAKILKMQNADMKSRRDMVGGLGRVRGEWSR